MTEQRSNGWHLHLKGQVQGVGFRPFVYLLARKYQLKGSVLNGRDGVHVRIISTEDRARQFMVAILDQAPPLSRITDYTITPAFVDDSSAFEIIHSQDSGTADLLLPPDFALCEACRVELRQPDQRRYHYAFTTCTYCGPRFSIIRDLPYDRPTTAMDPFNMCEQCEREYHDPEDRRYFAQTNSCPRCAIELQWKDASGKLLQTDPDAIYRAVTRAWRQGNIVAIKGIGGYLLTCDAGQATTVARLRALKQRRRKPLALLFPDIMQIRQLLHTDTGTEAMLQSPVAPIVLLQMKPAADEYIASEEVAPGLESLGVMMPYTPLYELLLQTYGRPVVATSGNRTNAPIAYRDEEAIEELSGIADYFLANNRQILIPQDDSVCRFTEQAGKRIILRRSRGWAPTFFRWESTDRDQCLLALGALLKSTFCLQYRGHAYISQYLGDLDHPDTLNNFDQTIHHFVAMFQNRPQQLICDLHPDYPSTRIARDLAARWQIPLTQVQHHEAHFAAILAEHALLAGSQPVLGVIWDGLGLGKDGAIWGGEFFIYEDGRMRRHAHFSYMPYFLADKMAKEPRLSALAMCYQSNRGTDLLSGKFSDTEWRIYQTLLQKPLALRSSSVGRIFDAVASLLNIMDKQTYEGEAAMFLEQSARRFQQSTPPSQLARLFGYQVAVAAGEPGQIDTETLIRAVVEDRKKGSRVDRISYRFHLTLVEILDRVAVDLGVKKLAFSGGVWQNALLVDLACQHLGDKYSLYFHEDLSPNDENISLGQLVRIQMIDFSG